MTRVRLFSRWSTNIGAIGLATSILLMACGDPGIGGSVGLALRAAEIPPSGGVFVLRLFRTPLSCGNLLSQIADGKDFPESAVTQSATRAQLESGLTVNNIEAGEYAVVVVVTNPNGDKILAYGCAPTTITNGKKSEVLVSLQLNRR